MLRIYIPPRGPTKPSTQPASLIPVHATLAAREGEVLERRRNVKLRAQPSSTRSGDRLSGKALMRGAEFLIGPAL
jgi:hypothetical protein